ncbi:MAG TPA: site-specific DNA-methyltransferase [Smithellaceae bacterium]|nr:site-specific DNA-methyltransferase [Smithellaceae bacterium]
MTEENKTMPTGLYWQGKKTEVDRIVLPFQTIETINESRATREKEKIKGPDIFKKDAGNEWHNRLIWGDNKYVMASLLTEFAGKIDLIYIDPPFATGADFSVKMEIGDAEWTKEPSAIEDKAYRDTWGKGLDSYLQMMYERLVLMRELLSEKGSIWLHVDYRVIAQVRLIMDEIFGQDAFQNEVIWAYRTAGNSPKYFARKHDNILWYKSRQTFECTYNLIKEKSYHKKLYNYGEHYQEYYDTDLDMYYSLVAPIDVWTDIYPLKSSNNERVSFITQKPEALLTKIIGASSNEGDLVADFFCGSGTTGAVAEKLGRRWIMADLGRFAIHTTRKRLLGIEGCKPFVVQNLGKYERQYWQGVTFKKRSDEQIPLYEYIQFILKLYNAEPLAGMLHLHGRKGKRLVHIGAVDAPVTFAEIQEAIAETKKAGQDSLDILGWEWEMGLHDVIEKAAKASGVHLRLFSIPRDVMDERAVEKGEITFYELAYLEVEVSQDKTSRFVVALKDFAIPNLDLIPQEVRKIVKKPFDFVDYWAVDWDWNEDTFHNMWQSYRTRKERKLELKSDAHVYDTKGRHLIMIKVIDIFGNDTTKVVEVKF